MNALRSLNLIACLDYYLVLTFVISTVMRYRQYRAIAGLVWSAPTRWPKLVQLLRLHTRLFFSWPTLLPVGITFLLMVIHLVAYNLFWPTARITPGEMAGNWATLLMALIFGLGMLVMDYDACFNVWKLDRASIDRDLDRAEYWLRSWVAPALSFLTLGRVNPRRIVHEETLKALTSASVDTKRMMWRWSLQIAVRFAFGLTLWLTWYLGTRGIPVEETIAARAVKEYCLALIIDSAGAV